MLMPLDVKESLSSSFRKYKKLKYFSKYKWTGWTGRDGLVGLMTDPLLAPCCARKSGMKFLFFSRDQVFCLHKQILCDILMPLDIQE
jgi:hypothetical protein